MTNHKSRDQPSRGEKKNGDSVIVSLKELNDWQYTPAVDSILHSGNDILSGVTELTREITLTANWIGKLRHLES